MKKFVSIILVSIVCVFAEKSVKAQRVEQEISIDSLRKTHSSGRAALYSTLIPGLGQIYNRKYWKVPLIYAGIGALFYFAREHNDKYQYYRDAEVNFDSPGPSHFYPVGIKKYVFEKNKEQRRRWRDMCYI